MDCPCGSGSPLEGCCARYLEGRESPPSAEALMRSRYTAFVVGKVDYILDTHHPDKRHEIDAEEVKRWASESEWLGLELRRVAEGDPDADTGKIEFIARYRDREGKPQEHHEYSIFKRLDGRWYFYDGGAPPGTQAKRDPNQVGRNEPCPCGSGKKFKKCHGRKGAS